MTDVLDRNLAALLRRAYVPARPRPAFRAELLGRVLERVPHGRVAPRSRTVRPWAPLRLAAAVLLAVLGLFAVGELIGDGPSGPARDEILARGDVAWRGAPGGGWRGHADPGPIDLAGDLAGTFLEVATPTARGVSVVAGGDEIVVGSAGSAFRLELAGAGAGLVVRVDAGEVTVRARDSVAAVECSEATLELARGRVDIALVSPDAAELDGLGGLRAGRPVARVRATGSARLASGPDAGPLTEGVDHYLQAGRRLEREGVAVADEGRTPLESGPPPARRRRAVPDDAALRGRVVDAETGDPIERFHLWMRLHVDLPKVTEPHLVTFDGEEFEPGVFFALGLPEGSYDLVVEAEGYAAWQVHQLSVPADEPLSATLVRGGTASGYVVDAETGAPLEGALVIAEFDIPQQVIELAGRELEPEPRAIARTDANGAYELSHLSIGRHQLRVSHPGYAPAWTRPFRLEPSEEGSGERPSFDVPDIALGRGGRVEGRVEREDGSPWAGAEIIVSQIAMTRPQPVMTFGGAVTSDDGTYAIDCLPEGYHVVLNLAEQPNEDPEWERVLQATVAEGETTTVDFLASIHDTRIFGTLLDTEGGALGGVQITLAPKPFGGRYGDWIATNTGADGSFELKGIEPARYGVFVSRDFMIMTQLAIIEVPDRPEFELELDWTGSWVRGAVTVAETGAVAPNAFLLIERRYADRGWIFAGRADLRSADQYAFGPLADGEYRLSVFATDGSYAAAFSEPVHVEAGESRRVDLEVGPGGSVHATVVDPDGEPLPGAEVLVVDPETDRDVPYDVSPATDGSGRQVVPGVAAGEWRVEASLEGYSVATEDVTVVVGSATDVRLVLTPLDDR